MATEGCSHAGITLPEMESTLVNRTMDSPSVGEHNADLGLPAVQQGLEVVREVLSNPAAQKDLVTLYSDSQSECTRNGKCGMEIGMSRENDLKAVLVKYATEHIQIDIDNDLVEDFRVKGEPVSVKHVTGKVGTGSVKAKWTSDADQAQQFIESMLTFDPSHYTHILLVYIDTKKKSITLVCVTATTVVEIVREHGASAFSAAKGTNNRGVSYASKTIADFLRKAFFTIEIKDVTLSEGLDPIQRRLLRLSSQ